MYKLLTDPVDVAMLGSWEKHLWHYDKVIGYSFTGTLFLYSTETDEYLVFYPSKDGSNCKGYGVFESVSEFENTILKDENFIQYALFPIDEQFIETLVEKLGVLGAEEIYFPVLEPTLGGSLELDNFDKGNVWIRTEILGLNRGL